MLSKMKPLLVCARVSCCAAVGLLHPERRRAWAATLKRHELGQRGPRAGRRASPEFRAIGRRREEGTHARHAGPEVEVSSPSTRSTCRLTPSCNGTSAFTRSSRWRCASTTDNWTMAFVAMNTARSTLRRWTSARVYWRSPSRAAASPASMRTRSTRGWEGCSPSLRPEDARQRHPLWREGRAPRLPRSAGVGGAHEPHRRRAPRRWRRRARRPATRIAAAENAFEEGDAAGFEGAHRVLLLTSGHATSGITDPDRILGLGEALVENGTAFGVIGVGERFLVRIPSALGSMGAGTYAYALSRGRPRRSALGGGRPRSSRWRRPSAWR